MRLDIKRIGIVALITALTAIWSVNAFADLKGHYYTAYLNGKFSISGFIEDEGSDRVKIRIDKVDGNWANPDCAKFGGVPYCIGGTGWVPKPNAAGGGYTVNIK